MRVILLQDIPHVGKKSEVKEVSDGYARNFLLPRNLVQIATKSGLKTLEVRRERVAREKSEKYARLQVLVEKIQSVVLRFRVKLGEKGKSFGSVTAAKISDAFRKKGIAVEKEWIMLEEGIKTTGEHRIPVKLPQGSEGTITIIVEAE